MQPHRCASPTPPTEAAVTWRGHGFEYTAEDRAYFAALLAYHYVRDPGATRSQVCALLAEKVRPPLPLLPFPRRVFASGADATSARAGAVPQSEELAEPL